MRILVFSWRDPKHPLAGGAEQVMHEHMKGWVKAGHTVTLFSSKVKELRSEEVIDGVIINRAGNQYLGIQIKAYLYYKKNDKSIDLVVDQFHGLPFFTPLYVKKPILAVIQETAREVWFLNPLPKPFNWIVGLLGYLAEPFFFLFYKRVHFMTGSNSALEDLVRMGIDKKNITVVPHGVLSLQPKPFSNKESKKTLVYLGMLSKDKGIEDALKCFQLLRSKGDYQFWVIGRAETKMYSLRIEKLAKRLNLNGLVKFWGYVSNSEKFKLLAKAHLLINPSIREGWGLVNIEANSISIPVIAYNSPGLVDSVKDGFSGIICKQNNPEELAQTCDNLLNDNLQYKRFQKKSLEWSKKFSWGKSSQKGLELIKSLL